LVTARAFVVVALVAAAAVSVLPPTPRAAPRHAVATCSPGSAVQLKYKLTVGGLLPKGKLARLRRGAWIHTDGSGEASLCLQNGGVTCRVDPNSYIQVLPPRKPRVLLRTGGQGGVSCSAKAAARSKQILTAGQTITLGDLGLGPATAAAQAPSSGNLFSVSVRRGRTVVKVRRGATIVSKTGTLQNAVVLGRDQQASAAKGKPPGDPTAIKLSAKEARVLDRLERLLPKDADKTPPSGGATGPAPFSSLRSPAFNFVANETGTTFSCAVDTSPTFRLCTNGERFAHLEPGEHELRVKATDRAGNSQLVTTYEWTIDSSLIVYASDRKSDGNTDVYVMDSDGLHQKQLTTGPTQDEDPEWSPDHRRIAFQSQRDGNAEIYVMNADGSGQTRLTNNPAPDTNPTWSPDGRQIAFESSRDFNREIYVMNADGTGVRRLTANQAQDLDPSWSPDGARIAFASDRDGNREIYRMDANGSAQTRLTNDPATDYGPSWSPDGSLIAFHSNRNATASDIYVMDPDGRAMRQVTRSPASDFNPQWAPDGSEIVFQSSRARSPKFDVFYVGVEDANEFRVTQLPGNHTVPDW
jgi:Tol biopolymer transport system component